MPRLPRLPLVPQTPATPPPSILERIEAGALANPPPTLRSGCPIVPTTLDGKLEQFTIAAHLRGTVARKPCSRCKKGQGPFADCMQHSTLTQCTNCT